MFMKLCLSSVSYFCSVSQSCSTLCKPMDCSIPGFPVFHHLPEISQTHVHWVGDAIQPSHSLLSPSPPAFKLSQHQGVFFSFFFFSSTCLMLQTHLPPPSCMCAQSCNPMDCSPPGSSVHGFFQARILEWVAISFSSIRLPWWLTW